MPAAASPKIVSRIKKCLALESSPNEHEASSARAEAERLMAKHGFKRSDFEEDTIEVIDGECDEARLRLARAVGASRRVVTLASKQGQLAYKGRPRGVSSASSLYSHMVDEVSRCCEIGPRDPGRVVWRLCYWAGFVDAVCDRLLDGEVQSWFKKTAVRAQVVQQNSTQPEINQHVYQNGAPKAKASDFGSSFDFIPPAIEEQRRAVEQFAGHFDPSDVRLAVHRLTQDAYQAGRSLGAAVRIDGYDREEVAAADRMLEAWVEVGDKGDGR